MSRRTINFDNLSAADKKELKHLLEQQQKALQDALTTTNDELSDLQQGGLRKLRKPRKPRKVRKVRKGRKGRKGRRREEGSRDGETRPIAYCAFGATRVSCMSIRMNLSL